MKFHEKLKAYRDEQLNISQEEAAKLLKISNVTLSRYESAERQPSLEMINLIRSVYRLSDEQFLDLLTDDKSTRKTAEAYVEQANESQVRYYDQFSPLIQELMKSKEFRALLLHLRTLSDDERKKLLRDSLAKY
ncbi:helix-turn-helix domain-containing protein [Chryseomicrobium aureum]|uniref:helix-turn-helix domain-containing protein n=1 Tax=Chryseomicrobium aureum TaxID=1441723 RepID=UPI00370D5C31